MRKLILIAAAFVLSVPQAAAAQDDEWDVPQPAWEGVWQGTVGSFPVHVCLDETPYDRKGAYYYDRVKRLFRLVPGKAPNEWFEQETFDKNGARWRIAAKTGAITGSWSDGKKQLPVRLARIGEASKDFDGPCGSMAFNRPRVAPVRLTSTRANLDGATYTKWTFKPGPWLDDDVQISTFTLDRPGAAVAKINARLRAALPKPDGSGEWLDCVAGNINASGMDGTYMERIEPTLVSDRWLAVNDHSETFCGGAHPDSANRPRTFDLANGTEVDPLDWLAPTAVHREDLGDGTIYKTLTAAFLKTLLSGWKGSEDCEAATRSQESWSAGIARGAIVFAPDLPHAVMACGEEFKIPFAKLQPWLSEKGKAAVATLPR